MMMILGLLVCIRGAAGAYHDPALGGGTNLAHLSCSNATSNHPVQSLAAEEGERTADVLGGGRAAAQGSWYVGSGHTFDGVHEWAQRYDELFHQGDDAAVRPDDNATADKATQLLSMKATGAGFILDPSFKLPQQDFFDL